MRVEIGKIKIGDVIWRQDIVDDIENFLNGNDRRKKMQRVLGVNMIFRGFIVKDWHGDNRNCKKYLELNKKLVKLSVACYWKCW